MRGPVRRVVSAVLELEVREAAELALQIAAAGVPVDEVLDIRLDGTPIEALEVPTPHCDSSRKTRISMKRSTSYATPPLERFSPGATPSSWPRSHAFTVWAPRRNTRRRWYRFAVALKLFRWR